jgi:SNF2 family DNA or RNA helicase
LIERPSAFVIHPEGDHNGYIVLATRLLDRSRAQSVPDGQFEPRTQVWFYPLTVESARDIRHQFQGQYLREAPSFKTLADQAITRIELPPEIDPSSTPIPFTKTDPWKHQLEAFWFCVPKPASLLDMWMGTGKSKVVGDIIANRVGKRHLILCPKSVVNVWPNQLKTHAAQDFEIVAIKDGSVAAKAAHIEEMLKWCDENDKPIVVILGYESSIRPPLGPQYDERNRLKYPGLLLSTQWDTIILDESHRIKSPSGKTSRMCRHLRTRGKNRLCLTGTPMPHSPLDIWAQFAFLDPTIFGDSFVKFRSQFALLGGWQNKQVLKWIRQDVLAEMMSKITFHAGADVLDLPPVQDIYRTCDLSQKARILYRKLEEEFFAELDAFTGQKNREDDDSGNRVTIQNVLVKLLRCQQVTSGYVRDDSGRDVVVDTGKREILKDILEDIPSVFSESLGKSVREPVAVFCRFRHDLDVVQAVCKELNLRVKELSGQQNDLTEDSKYPDGCDVLAVQIQSGGVGIDLTKAAYCVYYSKDRSLGNYDQSRARTHRPGQTRPVVYYHIQAASTIDQTIDIALQQRRDVIEVVQSQLSNRATGKIAPPSLPKIEEEPEYAF